MVQCIHTKAFLLQSMKLFSLPLKRDNRLKSVQMLTKRHQSLRSFIQELRTMVSFAISHPSRQDQAAGNRPKNYVASTQNKQPVTLS